MDFWWCLPTARTDQSSPRVAHEFFAVGRRAKYVALVAPDGTTVLSSYTFPQQRSDIAYGVAMAQAADSHGDVITSYGAVGYSDSHARRRQRARSSARASPPNRHSSHPDGFYSTSFSLVIGTTTPGARSITRSTARLPAQTNGNVVHGSAHDQRRVECAGGCHRARLFAQRRQHRQLYLVAQVLDQGRRAPGSGELAVGRQARAALWDVARQSWTIAL